MKLKMVLLHDIQDNFEMHVKWKGRSTRISRISYRLSVQISKHLPL